MIVQTPQGIVLRTFMPYAQKMLLLDVHRGKIQVVPKWAKKGQYIPHGALLHYDYMQRATLALVTDIELLQVPKGMCIQDFYFLHHVLELCDYFLQLEQQVPEIFDLLLALYTDTAPLSLREQQWFLYRFFVCIGVFPTDTVPLIFTQKGSNFDTKDAHVFKQLQSFLLDCLHVHPYAHLLKTLSVIKKLATHE